MKEQNKSLRGMIFFLVVVVCLALPFHYLPEHLMVFPKENLTFSNTIIFDSDINALIERYNNASMIERQAINQEPLMRKLVEKGLIVEQ